MLPSSIACRRTDDNQLRQNSVKFNQESVIHITAYWADGNFPFCHGYDSARSFSLPSLKRALPRRHPDSFPTAAITTVIRLRLADTA
eukprot:820131-Pleurochrysis_carterae.AAC.1